MAKNMKVIQINKYGTADNMKLVKVPIPKLDKNEVLLKVVYASVNFLDIQMRRGDLVNQNFYKKNAQLSADLPMTIGSQCLGVIEEVGTAVTQVVPGNRVVYGGKGTYATHVVANEKQLIPIIDDISDEQAAAGLTQGFLAYAFTHHAYPIQPGEWCLIQAAAGGMGNLICQMAKLRGAKIIGVTSSKQKVESIVETGADHVIISTEEDIAEQVSKITGGEGVRVVYDGVGKATFETNLNCLGLAGYFILYGQSSGYVPPIDIMKLQEKGSIFLTRTNGLPYMKYWSEYMNHFRDWIANGKLRIDIGAIYSLEEAKIAHAVMENRSSIGRMLIQPEK